MTTFYSDEGVSVCEWAGSVWMRSPVRVDMSSADNDRLGIVQPPDEEGQHEINLSAVTICELCGYDDPHDYGGPVTLMTYVVDAAQEVHHIKLAASKEALCAALETAHDRMALAHA